jgi:hypothetical protein
LQSPPTPTGILGNCSDGFSEWHHHLLPINTNRKEDSMTIDRIVMAFAGSMILVSVLLAVAFSLYWLFLTAFVGANMLQSSFTGFCPLAIILKKMGVKTGVAFS